MQDSRKPHPAAAYHQRVKSDRTERALAQARRIIEAEGLAALTVEKVAERTGIAKTTLYRRWDNSLALAREACQVDIDEVLVAEEGLREQYNEVDTVRLAVLAASVAERLGEAKA